MLPWIEATETGDRAELDFEPSHTLWHELAVGSDRCRGRRCPFLGSCFAEGARERAGEAELVIANHALYFADVAVRGKSDGAAVLPDHDAVVFDEAHRLEESAATWLGGRVSAAGLNRLAGDVDRACREAELPAPAAAMDAMVLAGERLLPRSRRRRAAGACASRRSTSSSGSRARSSRSPTSSAGATTTSTRSPAARSAPPASSRSASTRPSSSGSSGRSRARSPGRRSTSPSRFASCSGTTARPPCSSRRRSR